MKFGDLKTGDVMNLAGYRAVILAIEKPHPLNAAFWLFVWYIFDEKRISFDRLHPDYSLIPGSISFDMLHPEYSLIPGSTISQDGFDSYHRALHEIN